MTADDIPASHDLLSQLGYPLDRKELQRRYDAVVGAADHALLVAEHDHRIIALCHVYARPALDKPPEAVVQALVVDQASRGSGVGRDMTAMVERWARAHGFTSVALYSSALRSEAHAFYKVVGYRLTATSHLFCKSLG